MLRIVSACLLSVMLASCGRSKDPAVEDLTTHQQLTMFKLGALRGTRDGDRLNVQAMFTDTSSILTIDMHFSVGAPTSLESGQWRWTRSGQLTSGVVTARSVSFLGGQDGPPSIGGSFVLVNGSGTEQYHVTIPVTELKTKL